MFKILSNSVTKKLLNINLSKTLRNPFRTFLSQAYYCDEVWDRRLNSTLLQKVNLEELYYELDQRFQKFRQMSAVDVDVFANSVTDDTYTDELLDLLHKLRLTNDSHNTLHSTFHAAIRILLRQNQHDELLNILDDRLNYGIFLDYFTGNLLLDTFWKNKTFVLGARVASLFMLQEEFEHPLTSSLSLLHCYKYLLKPEGWPEYKPPEEPEEEVKIRVKYLRNPFDDEHFDLKDPNKIVGKTLIALCKNKNDPLNKSFHILGLILFQKNDDAEKIIEQCKKENIVPYKEILDLIPEENKALATDLKLQNANIEELLTTQVKKAEQTSSEKDIASQCKLFTEWENRRIEALEEQKTRLSTAKRLETINDLQKSLKDKETRLWFFENEENIELQIEAKKIYYPKRWFGKKKKPKKIDETYVPPEVFSKQTNPNQY